MVGPTPNQHPRDTADVSQKSRLCSFWAHLALSHANTIDRLAGNNELIFDVEHAVKDLIEAITQTDQKHMEALIASI